MTNDRSLNLPWLLVATPQLIDPIFKRRVVLIVEHGRAGSMGFVLNQKTQSPLSDLVSVGYVKIPSYIGAWYGGPVERQSGVILSNQTTIVAPQQNITPPLRSEDSATPPRDKAPVKSFEFDEPVIQTGYALSSSEETLIELVSHFEERRLASPSTMPSVQEGLYPYRFLIGYAGWGRGQLEREIRAGVWIQTPATPKLVFDTEWQQLWHDCMSQVGINPRSFAPSHHQYLN